MSTLFFGFGLLFLICRAIVLANFERFDTITAGWPGKVVKVTTPLQSAWVASFILEILWSFVGLFTGQWWAFIALFAFRLIGTYLTRRYYATRLAYYALATFALLMIILNHFHLHYKPAFL